MRNAILAFVLAAILLAGCDGDPSSQVFTGDQTGVPTTLVARLYLGVRVPDATLRLQDGSGAVLGTASTDQSGTAVFHHVVVPRVARVVGGIPGSSAEFAVELRDFDPHTSQAEISILSTLISQYMAAHPEASLAQAESLVKAQAGVPEVSAPFFHEPYPYFSTLAMLRTAGERGGWTTFSNEFLQQLDAPLAQSTDGSTASSLPTHYRLNQGVVERPVAGLDEGLQRVAELARRDLKRRYHIPDANFDQASSSLIALDNGASGGPGFMYGVAQGVVGNILSGGIDAAAGWITNAMGLNYGTSDQLKEIEGQLTALSKSLAQFEDAAQSQSLRAQIVQLQNSFDGAKETSDELNENIGATLVTNPPSNLPASTPTQILSLASDLGDRNKISFTIIDNANNSLRGAQGTLMSYQKDYLDRLGIDRPANMQFLPWRHNQILDDTQTLFTHFANLKTMMLNLLSEHAHNTFPGSGSPVTAISGVSSDLRKTLEFIKEQRQLAPLPCSDPHLLVDFESGLMWVAYYQSPRTHDDALSFVETYTDHLILPDGSKQDLSDWRLPTPSEYKSLQTRGQYVPQAGDPGFTGVDNDNTLGGVPVNTKKGPGDQGQSTAGLAALGFLNAIDALSPSDSSPNTEGRMWSTQATDKDSSKQTYIKLNLDIVSDGDVIYEDKGGTYPFLMCRSFGPNYLVNPDDLKENSALQGQDFVQADYIQWGVPSGIAISALPQGTSQTTTFVDATGKSTTYTFPEQSFQLKAEITYDITVGGAFTVGHGAAVKSLSYGDPHTSTSQPVDTLDRGTGASNDLNQLVSWSSSDPTVVEVYNLPFVSGFATPLKAGGSATLTASLLGANARTVQNSISYTVTTAAPRVLTSIQIAPRNQIYGGAPSQGSSGSFPYHCLGFYSDYTVADVTSQVVWAVEEIGHPNDANAQFVSTGSGVSLLMSQPAEATSVPYELKINAAVGTITDTTTIQIVPPVTP